MLYGALAALRQSNLRSMLAFSSISHVGLVIAGIAALNVPGLQGAVFQPVNFGVVAGGLVLLAGFLHHRPVSYTHLDVYKRQVYGALLAVLQIDLRRLLAFGIVSQTGVLVAGLFSLKAAGLKGALLLSLNLGLAAAGLFIAAGLLNRRLNTTRFYRLGGLFDCLIYTSRCV